MLLGTASKPADRSHPLAKLTVDTERAAGEACLRLSGEITRGTIQPLIDAVRDALAARCGRIRLCMQAVRLLDSGGLAALIVVARMADDAGTALSIEQPSPFAARILEIGGLAQLCEHASATGPA